MTSIAITGVSGYLGGYVADLCRQQGAAVVPLLRRPEDHSNAPQFDLRKSAIKAGTFRERGVRTLIHCGYDFQPRRAEDIWSINVEGTRRLFTEAREGGVERLILISSLSAYDGTRSLYGMAKLEQEKLVCALGGVCLRPGLIWSETPHGMVGTLMSFVRKLPVVPLIGGGEHQQFLIHIDDLSRIIFCLSEGPWKYGGEILPVAYPQSKSLRQILEIIAAKNNKKPIFIPVPWRMAYFAVKIAEIIVPNIKIRSDSIMGLIYSCVNPNLNVELLERLAGSPLTPFEYSSSSHFHEDEK